MTLNEYQTAAFTTDKAPQNPDDAIIVPLLGLAGEVGELLSEYKKNIWAGDGHKLWLERMSEELGDILWYLSNAASKFHISLEEVAERNLRKCRDRWSDQDVKQLGFQVPYRFDDGFPADEQLPRQMVAKIQDHAGDGRPKISLSINGKPAGNFLTDNAYIADGYRFHDVFHLTYAAVLGWSPVTRSNLKCKRRSNPKVDEVEDGGRAIVIEEGVSALVFSYAMKHSYLKNIERLDYDLLRTIKGMTDGLEVGRCTIADWERAIFISYDIWRQVESKKGGLLAIDLDTQSIRLIDTTESTVRR